MEKIINFLGWFTFIYIIVMIVVSVILWLWSTPSRIEDMGSIEDEFK